MDHPEYLELNERINAYREGVAERAAGWINANMPGITVDNTFADMDAYHAGLAMRIEDDGGEFFVWLTRNADDGRDLRVRVPSTLLNGVEA